MSKSVVSGMKYPHDHGIIHWNPRYVAPPFIIHLQSFSEVVGSDTRLVNRPENFIFGTKDLSSDLGIANFGVYVPSIFSPETCLVFTSFGDPRCSVPSKQPRSIVNRIQVVCLS